MFSYMHTNPEKRMNKVQCLAKPELSLQRKNRKASDNTILDLPFHIIAVLKLKTPNWALNGWWGYNSLHDYLYVCDLMCSANNL